MNYDWYNKEILKCYGTIKRARGSYLYTAKGVRLVDMYQEAGRAILGWGNCSGRSMLMLKNTMDRGITGSFATDHENRLTKAVLSVVPEYPHVRFYASQERMALAIAQYTGIVVSLETFSNLSFEEWLCNNGIAIWRPWLDVSDMTANTSKGEKSTCGNAMVVVPPVSWAGTGFICVFADKNTDNILVSDHCPPPFLAAATRAFYDLQKELPKRTEENWCIFDKVLGEYFVRTGPYLFPKIARDKYKDFVIHCIDKEMLVSPNYAIPSIIPFTANEGDFKKLKNNPFVV